MKLIFKEHELVTTKWPVRNYIIHKLIEAGMKINIKRKNKFDVSEYNMSEIEINSNYRTYKDVSNNDLVYEWL